MPNAQSLVFIDESGSLPDPHDLVVVVAVVVSDAFDLKLKRLLAKIRRKLPPKGKRKRERRIAELKFHSTSDKTRRQILHALAKQPVALFLLVLNKGGAVVEDTPENYARLALALLPDILNQFPQTQMVLFDRHFTRQADQEAVNRWIRRAMAGDFEIKHVDSPQDSRIDLADFVAGAVAWAHARGDAAYEDLIRGKIAGIR